MLGMPPNMNEKKNKQVASVCARPGLLLLFVVSFFFSLLHFGKSLLH